MRGISSALRSFSVRQTTRNVKRVKMLWIALFMRGRALLCAYDKANGATPKNEERGRVVLAGDSVVGL